MVMEEVSQEYCNWKPIQKQKQLLIINNDSKLIETQIYKSLKMMIKTQKQLRKRVKNDMKTEEPIWNRNRKEGGGEKLMRLQFFLKL